MQKWSKGKMKEKVNNLVLFDKVRFLSLSSSSFKPGVLSLARFIEYLEVLSI